MTADPYAHLFAYSFDELLACAALALALAASDDRVPYDRRVWELCQMEWRLRQVHWHLSHLEHGKPG